MLTISLLLIKFMAEFLLANRYFDPKNLSEPFENKVVDWAG
jgi:hypothetical protein